MDIKLKYIAFAVSLLAVSAAHAATYYVDAAAGNDANNGTSTTTAWKTIAKVNSKTFQPGDSILFRRGQVWREQLNLTSSGTSAAPISYGAFGTERQPPTISGADLVPAAAWRRYGTSVNVWVANIGSVRPSKGRSYAQVYTNGVLGEIARYPNQGFMIATSDSTVTNTVIDANLKLPQSQVVGATAIVKSAPWSVDPYQVTGFNGTTGTITMSSNIRYTMRVGYGYYLRNQLWMLDAPKEWYYDEASGNLYIWLPTGANPAQKAIEITTRDNAIYGAGKHYVAIRDLNLARTLDSGIYIASGEQLTLEGLSVSQTYSALNITANNSVITKNAVSDALYKGIHVLGSNNTISSNRVANTGVAPLTPDVAPVGIYVMQGSVGTNVTGNMVSDSGYSGIHFDGKDIQVRKNTVDRSCVKLDDCGGIRSWSNDANNNDTGNIIDRNTVTNSIGNIEGSAYTTTQAQGIYLDDRRHDFQITNNVISNVDIGLYIHNGYNHVATGNRFLQLRNTGVRIVEDKYSPAVGYVKNNQIKNNVMDALALGKTPMMIKSTLGGTKDFGEYNYNIYCRVSSVATVNNQQDGQPTMYHTLSGWQQYSGQDLNSQEYIGSCPAQPVFGRPAARMR